MLNAVRSFFRPLPIVTAAAYARPARNAGYRAAVTIFVDGKINRTVYGSFRHYDRKQALYAAFRAKYKAECMALDARMRATKERVEIVLCSLGVLAFVFAAVSLA